MSVHAGTNETTQVGVSPVNMAIETYTRFAIVSVFFNPIMGAMAVYFSYESKKAAKIPRIARVFSDLAYGYAFVGIIASVIITIGVYALGLFPDYAYYDREMLIKNSIK